MELEIQPIIEDIIFAIRVSFKYMLLTWAMGSNRKSPTRKFEELPTCSFCDLGQHLLSLGLNYLFYKLGLNEILGHFESVLALELYSIGWDLLVIFHN